MRSFNNHLLLLAIFLFSFSHDLFRLARSDESLINKLCDKTEDPDFCKQCLEANPNSKSADGKGLAVIAVTRARKDTTYLHDDILKLVQNTTGKLKNILDGCTTPSFTAQQEFQRVTSYVQLGQYGVAKDTMTREIIPRVNYCLKQFQEDAPELAVPSKVLAGTVAANQTCRNAAGILSNL